MAVDFVKSQGTEIFILPDPLDTTAMKMACPTAVSKSGGARTMSEILCLDADDPEFISGSCSSTTWSIPFALVPTDTTHQELFALETLGEAVPFLIALSDGTAAPTVTAGALVAPAGRTSFAFDGIVMEIGIDIATNDVVRGTLSVQQSGPLTRTWKTP